MLPSHYNNGKSIYRIKAFRNYSHECEICGYNEYKEILEVHHIDGNRENNEIDNLIILCPNHHSILTLGCGILNERKIEYKK